jgi:hypothetical protein
MKSLFSQHSSHRGVPLSLVYRNESFEKVIVYQIFSGRVYVPSNPVFLHIVWIEIPFLVRLSRHLCEAPGKTRDEGGAFSPAFGRLVGLVCVCMCIEFKDV